MNVKPLPDGSKLYYEPRGAMLTLDLAPGVVLHVCRGITSDGFLQPVLDDGERMLSQHGRCVFLVDSYDSKSTSTKFRDGMGEWFSRNEARATAHLLIRSKLLEMAATLANMIARRPAIVIYSNTVEWEAVGRHEVPAFRRKPMVLPPELVSQVQL